VLVGGQVGSKTLLQQNPAVLNWWCRLIQLVLSNAMKFVTRYGVMSGQYKSTLGTNFHFYVCRFKFNQWAFLMDVLMLIM